MIVLLPFVLVIMNFAVFSSSPLMSIVNKSSRVPQFGQKFSKCVAM